MRRFWRPETGVFLGIWLVLMATGPSKFFHDPGTFWHLVIGRRILASGQVPRVDSLSFTYGDQPWVATQWLAECVMAATHAGLGWDGLLLIAATLLAGLYTWITHRLLAAGLHILPAALVVTVVVAGSSHHFHARPHLATLLFLTCVLARVIDVENGKKKVLTLWLCPLLLAVWANIHGGALAGWATLGLVVAGWIGFRLLRWESPLTGRLAIFQAAGLLLASAAAMLINPYGIDTLRTWLTVMSLDLPDLIEEHAPLDVHRPEGIITLLLLAIYGAMLASTWPKRPRVTWLLPCVWAVLAWGRVRHAPLFALAAALAMADMLPFSRLIPWLTQRGWWSTQDIRPIRPRRDWLRTIGVPAGVALMPILAAICLQSAGIAWPIIGRGWARLDDRLWPVDFAETLAADSGGKSQDKRILNSLDLGGFVSFFAPDAKIFIDDRCELFGGEFLRRYAAAEAREPQWLDRWAEEYQVRRALVRPGSLFDQYLSQADNWQETNRAAGGVLYLRRPDTDLAQTRPD